MCWKLFFLIYKTSKPNEEKINLVHCLNRRCETNAVTCGLTYTVMSVMTRAIRVQVSIEKFGSRSMTCPFEHSKKWIYCTVRTVVGPIPLLRKSQDSTPCALELRNDVSPSEWLLLSLNKSDQKEKNTWSGYFVRDKPHSVVEQA